jgi:hypothetical protein
LACVSAENCWPNETIEAMEKEMEKKDFRKELKHLYVPSAKEFSIVDVPPMRYLMIDGSGNPNVSKEYKEAIEALYAVSYALKFTSKKELGKDYVVPPLEGLWWADDMSAFIRQAKGEWRWTMMIMQPEWITRTMIAKAVETVRAKKPIPGLSLLREEVLREGRSAQIMHIGPYADEAPVLARLHNEYLPQNGLVSNGKHHEIYIGDPRKTAPSKLKTVLRQPVKGRSSR